MTHHVRTIRNMIVSVAATLLAASALALDAEKVLHTFSGGSDGAIGGDTTGRCFRGQSLRHNPFRRKQISQLPRLYGCRRMRCGL